MDHPALSPSSVALARIDRRVPKLDNNGLVKLPSFPRGPDGDDYVFDGPGWLFLGHFYTPTVQPDAALAEYLALPSKQRRAWYLKALLDAQAEARDHNVDQITRLVMEEQIWLRFDDLMLNERVWPYVNKWDESDGDHWIWNGRFDGTRPSLSWRGQDDVPVYQILWARERRTVLIGDRRPRKVETCPELDPYRRCVNPHHFAIAHPRDSLRAPRVKVGLPTGRYTGTVRWSLADVNDQDQILCPRCQHPLGEAYQQRYKLGMHRGTAWCLHCAEIERRVAANRSSWPRISRPSISPDEEAELYREIALQNPFGGGPQVVPPDPEPIRYVQPAYEEPDQNDI